MRKSSREIIGAMAASGAVLASTAGVRANPALIDLAQIRKETDIACVYHCDFGDPQRLSRHIGALAAWCDGGCAAGVSPPRVATLLDRDGGDDHCRDRIGPPPAERGVGQQADE